MESERREQLALRGPVRRQSMLLVPVGGESNRLRAIQHISDDVRRKEGEINHLLNAPFGCALAGGYLSEGFARFDLREPVMRLCDIADECLILTCRCITYDEFGLTPRLRIWKGAVIWHASSLIDASFMPSSAATSDASSRSLS